MTELKKHDKIRLKTGERGAILETFDDGSYLVEFFAKDGLVDIAEVTTEDIQAIIIEVEKALNI